MTGEKEMFTSFESKEDSNDAIIFADNRRGKILRLGKIALSTEHSISNVFLVETLTYNLLSVSQICDMCYNCLFTNEDVIIFRRSDSSMAFKGVCKGKPFVVDLSSEKAQLDTCFFWQNQIWAGYGIAVYHMLG